MFTDLLNINPLELLLHLDDPMDEEKFEIYKAPLGVLLVPSGVFCVIITMIDYNLDSEKIKWIITMKN
jgi:hypothetical protein